MASANDRATGEGFKLLNIIKRSIGNYLESSFLTRTGPTHVWWLGTFINIVEDDPGFWSTCFHLQSAGLEECTTTSTSLYPDNFCQFNLHQCHIVDKGNIQAMGEMAVHFFFSTMQKAPFWKRANFECPSVHPCATLSYPPLGHLCSKILALASCGGTNL